MEPKLFIFMYIYMFNLYVNQSVELGSYLVGANRLLDEFEVVRLFVDFRYSSSLSKMTSGLSFELYVKHRFMNVCKKTKEKNNFD
jgi:hypothetical protein